MAGQNTHQVKHDEHAMCPVQSTCETQFVCAVDSMTSVDPEESCLAGACATLRS